MPRTPKNPGSGKPPHNGPARPGRRPASGTPAGGAGHAPRPAAPFTAANQPAPEAKSAGRDVAREVRERIAARKDELLAAQFGRALDPAHPHGHAAAESLLARIAPPKQEITGGDGGPLGFVIYGEREAEDADAWQRQHAPR